MNKPISLSVNSFNSESSYTHLGYVVISLIFPEYFELTKFLTSKSVSSSLNSPSMVFPSGSLTFRKKMSVKN